VFLIVGAEKGTVCKCCFVVPAIQLKFNSYVIPIIQYFFLGPIAIRNSEYQIYKGSATSDSERRKRNGL
jgi:3-hydroxymyristoyl/3-hydroxydecanoyl-(acyl carrier protein) dehydratase